MPGLVHVTTTINGNEAHFLCEPRQSLLECLRDVVGMTGSKEGCNDGNCGACTVNLDGRIVCSCLVLGVEAEGAQVNTIEGVASADGLHPIQQAFLENAALQCGICTPGFIVAAKACWTPSRTPTKDASATGWPATCAAAPATTRSSAPCWTPGRRCGRGNPSRSRRPASAGGSSGFNGRGE